MPTRFPGKHDVVENATPFWDSLWRIAADGSESDPEGEPTRG
jgi:hypothetical protein